MSNRRTLESVGNLAATYSDQQNRATALEVLQPGLETDRLRFGSQTQDRLERASFLLLRATILTQLARWEEAEPVLVAGYQGLKERSSQIPDNSRLRILRDAVERLVKLYEAWGKPDEAAVWAFELRTHSDQLSVEQPKANTDEQNP